jgi:hypothetical protein
MLKNNGAVKRMSGHRDSYDFVIECDFSFDSLYPVILGTSDCKEAQRSAMYFNAWPEKRMNYALIEIYQLLLNKHFRPEVEEIKPNIYKLYLWSSNGKYFTSYILAPGKIKWTGGVMPDRILH